MLVLSRKVGEKLVIGENVTITINRVSGNRVTVGIQAPGHVRIVRGELDRFEDMPQEPVGVASAATSMPSEQYRTPVIAHRHS